MTRRVDSFYKAEILMHDNLREEGGIKVGRQEGLCRILVIGQPTCCVSRDLTRMARKVAQTTQVNHVRASHLLLHSHCLCIFDVLPCLCLNQVQFISYFFCKRQVAYESDTISPPRKANVTIEDRVFDLGSRIRSTASLSLPNPTIEFRTLRDPSIHARA
jgi:hypothetical protein